MSLIVKKQFFVSPSTTQNFWVSSLVHRYSIPCCILSITSRYLRRTLTELLAFNVSALSILFSSFHSLLSSHLFIVDLEHPHMDRVVPLGIPQTDLVKEAIQRAAVDAGVLRDTLHREGFPGARLAVREDADVESVEDRQHKRLHFVEHVRLRGASSQHLQYNGGRDKKKFNVLVMARAAAGGSSAFVG